MLTEAAHHWESLLVGKLGGAGGVIKLLTAPLSAFL